LSSLILAHAHVLAHVLAKTNKCEFTQSAEDGIPDISWSSS